jgi:putative nucleotidyltransferase with HDIG domain
MTSPLHRVGQFWRHASARVATNEAIAADAILGSELGHLFRQLPVNDQRHGLDVLATVARLYGAPDRLLQQAALLHDVGKAGTRFSVIERSLAVFLESVSPAALKRLMRARPDFGRRYSAYRDHASIGAERLRGAGAFDLAAVVQEHHAPAPKSEVTKRLQRADRRN